MFVKRTKYECRRYSFYPSTRIAARIRQVEVNADLRTSVTELRATSEALLQVATIYQQNFERLSVEINADRQTNKKFFLLSTKSFSCSQQTLFVHDMLRLQLKL
ncbi:MAG: hypothetical protein H0X31_00065 [Nostocaceae cyanobacterium]|nr:hypothetical protein [Nostocaceae cyanobacterium]